MAKQSKSSVRRPRRRSPEQRRRLMQQIMFGFLAAVLILSMALSMTLK